MSRMSRRLDLINKRIPKKPSGIVVVYDPDTNAVTSRPHKGQHIDTIKDDYRNIIFLPEKDVQ